MHNFQGIVPYLFYDDVAAAITWYTNVFGFKERSRWENDQGVVQNAEMQVGNTEIWMDGGGAREETDKRPTWIGVWVDDVDRMYEQISQAGVNCEPPENKAYGVRTFNVADEFGHLWGFMKRI